MATALLPRLQVGVAIQPAALIARALKVSRPAAWAIMRRVLESNGVEVYRDTAFCRLVVSSLPEIDGGTEDGR